jgi:hypothetical protein
MTFQEVQRIKDKNLLRSLKQHYIELANKCEDKTNRKYTDTCDKVDWIHWRIKEIE